MTARNNVTGDKLITKPATSLYRDNWDKIFKSDSTVDTCCKKCNSEVPCKKVKKDETVK